MATSTTIAGPRVRLVKTRILRREGLRKWIGDEPNSRMAPSMERMVQHGIESWITLRLHPSHGSVQNEADMNRIDARPETTAAFREWEILATSIPIPSPGIP